MDVRPETCGGDMFAALGPEPVGEKMAEMGGRDLRREDAVGIVRRSAAGFADGVLGRVGGTWYSGAYSLEDDWKLAAIFARDEAVEPS